jgi:hypothetical protein
VVLVGDHDDHSERAAVSVQAGVFVTAIKQYFSRLTWHHLLILLGVLTLITTTIGVVRHFTPVPLGDQWDGTIGFYLRAQHDPLGAWFEQHNEHRLVFSRFLFYCDVRYFGGRNVSLLAANLVLAGLIALTIVRIAVRRIALSQSQTFGLIGTTLLFTFSWMQFENWTWGFQNQWYAVCLFALWAFESVERCADNLASANRAKANGWLIAAWLCSIAAAGSMASGLLVIAVAVAQGIVRRVGIVRVVFTLVLGAVIWFLYFRNWHAPTPSDARNAALDHPLRLVEYALVYLGSAGFHTPLAYLSAYAWGAVVALTALFEVLRLFARSNPALGSFLAYALFGAANALLTASGRLIFGIESALSSRYTTISLLCALTLMLFSLANAKSVRGRRVIVLAGCIAIILLAIFQRLSLRGDEDERYGRNVGGLAVRAHVYDNAVTKPIYPFEDRLVPTAKEAEAAGLSIFAADQRDYFVPPPSTSAAAVCDGQISRIWATKTPGVYGASGWIYHASSGSVPDAIVIAAPAQATLGSGIVGGRNDEARSRFGSRARDSDWTAFFRATPGNEFIVEGRIGQDRYCRLRTAGNVNDASPASN